MNDDSFVLPDEDDMDELYDTFFESDEALIDGVVGGDIGGAQVG